MTTPVPTTPFCTNCGDTFPQPRRDLGYTTCLECGDRAAQLVRFTVMPAYSKGAYQVVSPHEIAHTNPKGSN